MATKFQSALYTFNGYTLVPYTRLSLNDTVTTDTTIRDKLRGILARYLFNRAVDHQLTLERCVCVNDPSRLLRLFREYENSITLENKTKNIAKFAIDSTTSILSK